MSRHEEARRREVRGVSWRLPAEGPRGADIIGGTWNSPELHRAPDMFQSCDPGSQ